MLFPRRLVHLLLLSHVGLVLLLALLLLFTGAGAVRSLVIGQAGAQSEQAIAEARRRLLEWRRELSVAAGLLAEQPTLEFYLGRGQITLARALVADFVETSQIEYMRVQQGDRTVAEIGKVPPSFSTGFAFDARRQAWQVVRNSIPSLPDTYVVVAERLGNRLDFATRRNVVALELRPLATEAEPGDAALIEAMLQVSLTGDSEFLEGIGDSAVVRLSSLRDGADRPVAIITARVPNIWVKQRTLEWLAAFGAASLATGAIALVFAALLASRISRPFAELAKAAERLGAGDLGTPVAAPRTSLVEPLALAANLEDMRSQVRALTETERSQRMELDAVLDGVDEGIVGVDSDNRIHYVNRQFLELLDCTREDVLGRPWDSVLRPMRASVSAGSTLITEPGVAVEHYGRAGHSHSLVARRVAASGDRFVIVVREESPIEAARTMRDTILANLSHEFQTPISAQMASIELLRDHLLGSADSIAVRLTDAQYRGTLRLSQLVENLLDSVRIESGEMRLRRQDVDLPAVVREAVDLMQPLIDQRDQRVVLALTIGPHVAGDSQRLSSVVVNLLANANKFAPDQTTIWIETEWQASTVTIWVEDEGPGLPPLRFGGDLFAPFRRSPEEEPSQRGTGLGLAIVQAIVNAHGGDVVISQPQHRSGARIGVVLPLEARCVSS